MTPRDAAADDGAHAMDAEPGATSMDFARALHDAEMGSEHANAHGGDGWTDLLAEDLEPLRGDRVDDAGDDDADDDDDGGGDGGHARRDRGGRSAQSVLRHSENLGNAFKLAREDVGEEMLGALDLLRGAERALKDLSARHIASRDKANEELMCIKENVETVQQKISESFM